MLVSVKPSGQVSVSVRLAYDNSLSVFRERVTVSPFWVAVKANGVPFAAWALTPSIEMLRVSASSNEISFFISLPSFF